MLGLRPISDMYQFELFSDLSEKYSFMSNLLFPNNTTIFQSEIDFETVRTYPLNFVMSIFPVYKLFWIKVFPCYNEKTNMIYLDNKNIKSISINAINDMLSGGFDDTNEGFLVLNNKLKISYSAYAYVTILSQDYIKLRDLNTTQICGLVESGNHIGIFSDNKKYAKTNLFNFENSKLRSIQADVQIKIFDIFLNRSNCIFSGGTGIGKTTIIPKIFWWYNLLFDGFEAFNKKNKDFIFLDIIFNINNFKRKHTLLSLPRKALINQMGKTYVKSLGLIEINNSPVILKYKDVKLFKNYYNTNTNKFPCNIIISVNRKSINNLQIANTVMIDEVHEHDKFGDITIAVAKKLKKKYGIRNIVLISATIEFEIENIRKFFKNNISEIYIPGKTLFPIIEKEILNENIISIVLNNLTEKGKSIIIFCETVSKIESIYNLLQKNINNKDLQFHIIHGKISNVNEEITKIETNKKFIHIIISTNYLESSITIKNAKVVIDNGKVFRKQFLGGRITNITSSMYKQRMGRVGRVSDGIYIRTYSKKKINDDYKDINYQYLWDYIIIFRYYDLDLKTDYFVIPDDLNRVDNTIEYLKVRNIDIYSNISKIYRLYNKYEINMIEYLNIYLNQTEKEITMIDDFLIDQTTLYNNDTYLLLKSLNVRCKLCKFRRIKNYLRCEFSFKEKYFDGPNSFVKFFDATDINYLKKKTTYYMIHQNPIILIT